MWNIDQSVYFLDGFQVQLFRPIYLRGAVLDLLLPQFNRLLYASFYIPNSAPGREMPHIAIKHMPELC